MQDEGGGWEVFRSRGGTAWGVLEGALSHQLPAEAAGKQERAFFAEEGVKAATLMVLTLPFLLGYP